MMAEYRISSELRDIAEYVIENTPELYICKRVDICYMTCSTAKKTNGKTVYADCEKVKDKNRIITPYDFIITAYEPNIERMTEEQLKILMLHELKHVGIEETDAGMRKFTRPHDYEDFYDIVKKYGSWWAEEGNADVVF